MVTVHSAFQIGLRLIRKNRGLLAIPLIWFLSESLLLYVGLTPGVPGNLYSQFFIRFALPASWPGIDQILPTPILSPNFVSLLSGGLDGNLMSFFSKVVIFVLFDSFARSWFMVTLRNTFAGQKPKLISSLNQSLMYLNSFIILRLITLAGLLFITALARTFPGIPSVFWDIPITLGTLAVLPTDMVLVLSTYNMPGALVQSLILLRNHSIPLLKYSLVAALINGVLSVPINWCVGFWPGFILSGVIFVYCGVMLSAGLMYIFTSSLLATREG